MTKRITKKNNNVIKDSQKNNTKSNSANVKSNTGNINLLSLLFVIKKDANLC